MPRFVRVLLLLVCLAGCLAAQTQGPVVYTGVSPVDQYVAKDPSAKFVSADAHGITLSTPQGGVRITGNSLTYQDAKGSWQPAKPQIASDNAGGWKQSASPADVSVVGGGAQKRLRVGKGADGWDLILENVAHKSGNDFSFTIGGQPWRLRILPNGSQIETTIAAKQGAKTYALDYSPGGAAVSVDAKGNLVIGGIVTRRAVMVGADKSQWSCGPWVADKKAISFTCDDKDLPAKALPYVIDPTTTIGASTVTCSGVDDGTTCSMYMQAYVSWGAEFDAEYSIALPAGVTVTAVDLTSSPRLSGNCGEWSSYFETPTGGAWPPNDLAKFNLTGGQTVRYRIFMSVADAENGTCFTYVDDSIALQISYVYPAAAPTFSPVAGTYTTAQNIALSSTTPGATIRYTTDGSTPAPSYGTIYTAPIAVGLNSAATIKAVAYASGYATSAVSTGAFTITGTVAAPSFSPGPATYTSAQSVTITTSTSGASIRYTTDGSAPTSTTGTVYTGPVSIATSATLKAIAYRAAWADSTVTTGAYTLSVTTPGISPAAGTYTAAQTVTLSTPTSGASIRYTTDGSTPTSTTGTLYSAPFTVSATQTVKAIAYLSGWTTSSVASAAYTITGTVATPTFSPAAGTYTSGQSVAISTTTSGASIRYTTDGSTPTSTIGSVYSAPIAVNASQTINAIAYKATWADSAVASAPFTITGTVAQPTMSPAPGSYVLSQAITLSSITQSASIRYTTDGSAPSSTTGTLYTAPFTLSASATVKAIAYRASWVDSPIASGQYTIMPPAVTLTAPANAATNQPISASLTWTASTSATSYDVYLGTGTPALIANVTGTSYAPTLLPGYTYSWYVVAKNATGAGNASSTWSFTTTLNSPSTYDGRRTGVKSTGAYWGAAGEQIDLLSGNLNFTVPLLSAQTRGGVKLPLALSYNSQLWRETSGFAWKLGRDVGYGFGWTLQAGSLAQLGSMYVFTDATGAEYKLDQFANGVYTSSDGSYISYVELTALLYLNDGTVWTMSAQSASGEADAGTRYPTRILDTNGNWIQIDYAQGSGGGGINTSARITRIQDSRMWSATGSSYLFTYNTDATPHLTEISPMIATPEHYTFSYQAGQTLTSPGGTPFGTASLLQAIAITGLTTTHTFQYATGTAEMTQVTTGAGGTLSWQYATQTYPAGQKFREVRVRKMKASAADVENTWNLTPANDPALNLHPSITVADVGANSQKYWRFTTTVGPYLGVSDRYEERTGGGTAIHRKDYTWTQGPSLNPYVTAVTTTLDPGTAYEIQTKSTQVLDAYGNISNSKIYPYGNLSTPARTYEYTYLHESNANYAPRYIRNRVSEVYLTDGASPRTRILWKRYDVGVGNVYYLPQEYPATLTQQNGAPLHDDANFGTSFQYRGNVAYVLDLASDSHIVYATTGVVTSATNGAGVQVSASTSSNTGYSLPETLTPGGNSSLSTSIGYNSGWAVTSVTGANGANSTTTYDTYGRPTSSKIPDGAVTNYTYTYNPDTQTATLNGRWTKTTQDGFGRTIKVETGNGGTTVSVAETEYAPCACSPLGKLKRTSRPHAPGGAIQWTTNTYDASGRTLTVTLPDNSVTTYLYTGNTTQVTDAAGKWKKHTTDVFGNLVTVTEPTPTGGQWTTSYFYDGFNHLTRVEMPRPYNGGTYTQVRTFTWSGNVMTSETNPETGTVSYDYDRAGRLVSRIDAKHQKRGLDYDQYGRLSAKRYYRCDVNNSNCVEDTNARVDYYYDYNPYDASRSQNAVGRLAVMEFKTPGWVWGPTTTRYHYSYNEAGRVTNQWLQLQPNVDQVVRNVDIDATYTWDNEGRMTSQQGPWSGPVESYTYDSMGRLSTGGATYGPAGELLTFNGVTRTYNSLGQLTRMTKTGAMDIEYIYTAGQNNGRITRAKDYVTGEDITYQYDSLNRLMHAETADSLWGTTYSYDGWGNLTAKATTKGAAPTFSQTYDPALNMAVGSNPPSYVPTDYSNNYDIEDRPKHGPGEFNPLNGAGGVGYDPSGKKVFWAADGGTSGQCEIYFFSITGQRLAQFGCKFGIGDSGSIEWSVWMAKRRTHVGGQLTTDTDYDSLGSNPTARDITTDRLGSIRARGTERYTYYPYGEVRTSTGTSSLYAALESPVRGYDSNAGRFDRPDPLGLGAVKMGDPGSWNRFAYVQGDPVNYADPGGKFALSTAELEQWATKLVDRNGSNAFGIQYALTQWRIASLETAAMQEAMFRDTMMGAMNGAAIDAAQEARNFMVGRFTSGAFSQECQGKLDALGVNAEQMAASLSGASFSTTMGNLDSFADLYKDSTQYGNAKAQYKNLTIDHFFDDNPNVSAVSSLGGNRIYLNPSVVNNYGSAYMAALLSHEVLHNMGMDDDTIKKKLGIPAGGDTRSITLSMFSCVPGQ